VDRPLKRSLAKNLAKTAAANLARSLSQCSRYPEDPHLHGVLLEVGLSLSQPNGLSGLAPGTEGIEQVEIVVVRAAARAVVSCHPPYVDEDYLEEGEPLPEAPHAAEATPPPEEEALPKPTVNVEDTRALDEAMKASAQDFRQETRKKGITLSLAEKKKREAERAAAAYKKRAADAEVMGAAALQKAAEQRAEILDELRVLREQVATVAAINEAAHHKAIEEEAVKAQYAMMQQVHE